MSRRIANRARSGGRGLAVESIGSGSLFGVKAIRYRVGECTVIQTSKRHLSISHETRDPTWEEIAAARYALLPRLRDCAMVMPPDDNYVNVHEHCFHVFVLRELAPGGEHHSPEGW